MLRRLTPIVVALAAPLALSATAPEGAPARRFDWPQWQGPRRTARSDEMGLLADWPREGPPLARTITGLGEGYSTPTVAAGRIFTMGNRGDTEYVLAFAESDGKELWAAAVGPVRANGGGYAGPRCSPTVDGDRVYALGLNGDLVCLEPATGKRLWAKDLRKDFEGQVGGWGYSESPLVDGDKLLCTPGGSTATLVALNKRTGDTVWQGAVPQGDQAHYSSIIAADLDGRRQFIQFLSGGVVGLSADDGRFLWRYDHPHNGTANCSTPVYRAGYVFAASSYGTGGGLARLTHNGDGVSAEEVYFTRNMKNHHGGMVLVGDFLYGSDEGQLTCLEFLTGRVRWADHRAGKGSIAYADGRLYYRNEGGPVVLVEATPDRYVEHGRFQQPQRSDKPAWPHPVIANGKLYIRDQDRLFCYDVKAR
jgi:outer membrane protein assembly factor BamB